MNKQLAGQFPATHLASFEEELGFSPIFSGL